MNHYSVTYVDIELLWQLKTITTKKTISHPSCLVPFVQVAEVGPLVPEFDICGLEKLRGAHLWFLDEKVVSFCAQLNIRLALGES